MADPENKLFDKRVAHRYLRKGKLDEKEWERHQKSLPDLADQAMPIEASIDSDDLDDLDDLEDDVDDGADEPTTGAGGEGGPGGETPQQP